VIVIGIMVVKQMIKKKNEKELSFLDPYSSENPNTIENDIEHSQHVEESEHMESSQNIEKRFEDIEKSVEESKIDEKDKK